VVQNLVKNGAKIDQDEKLLNLAVLNGNDELVCVLLELGVDVTSSSSIHIASAFSHAEIVAELVKAGADVNMGHKKWMHSLIVTCQHGQAHMVSVLGRLGDVNARFTDGTFLLFWVCKNGHVEVVKELLKYHNKNKYQKNKLKTNLNKYRYRANATCTLQSGIGPKHYATTHPTLLPILLSMELT
jgi:ankyrin repeat protein